MNATHREAAPQTKLDRTNDIRRCRIRNSGCDLKRIILSIAERIRHVVRVSFRRDGQSLASARVCVEIVREAFVRASVPFRIVEVVDGLFLRKELAHGAKRPGRFPYLSPVHREREYNFQRRIFSSASTSTALLPQAKAGIPKTTGGERETDWWIYLLKGVNLPLRCN